MTIKEMETRSGLPRANIRFYESEGLLAPTRKANGYRDYSEEDLAALLRVRLLRSLHISLEEIKAIQAGAYPLSEVLARHLGKLDAEKKDIERSKLVCQEIQADGADYATLDAPRYLEHLEREDSPELTGDTIPRVQAPWRRFFARTMDLFLCTALWKGFLILEGINIENQGLTWYALEIVAALLLLLFLEPLFLCKLGTTPGKAILGLSVTDLEGHRLTYKTALDRTMSAIARGMGCDIPIYSLVRYVKSYMACQKGQELPWETASQLTLREDRMPLRVLGLLGAYVGVVTLVVLSVLLGRLPDHRGEITVEQFCENYNQMAQYYGTGSLRLSPDGHWIEPQTNTGAYLPSNTIDLDGLFQTEPPQIVFQQENGVMTGLCLTLSAYDSAPLLSSGQVEMQLAILAFVCAQEEYSIFSDQVSRLSSNIANHAFQPFDETLFGVTVSCQVDLKGYIPSSAETGILWPEEEEGDGQVVLTFTMEKA